MLRLLKRGQAIALSDGTVLDPDDPLIRGPPLRTRKILILGDTNNSEGNKGVTSRDIA